MLLLSTNTEKAFDRLDWTFMQHTLAHIGILEPTLAWIKAL